MTHRLVIASLVLASGVLPRAALGQQAGDSSIKPRVNTVTLSRDDFSCSLSRYSGFASGAGTLDGLRNQLPPPLTSSQAEFCDEAPSVEINFQVDMFGSKVVTRDVGGRRVSTEAGKYVVVTVSPNAESGAGWHLADQLRHKQDFASPIAGSGGRARAESLGPVANRYQFWIRKPAESAVRLVDRFPANTAKEVDINEERNIVVGITGTVGAKIGGSLSLTGSAPVGGTGGGSAGGTGGVNGEISGQLAGSIQQTNGRKLSYKGSEYTIDNKSSSKLAKWAWDLKLEDDPGRICDYLNKRDTNTCFFTMPLLDSGRIINASRFSAAAYGNFLPTFQAVFKAAPDYAGVSSFEVGTDVELASMVAAARPAWSPNLLKDPANLVPGLDGASLVISSLLPDVLKFDAELKPTAAQGVTGSFSVDWDQPYFAPEQNIRLQVVSPYRPDTPETAQTLCLAAAAGRAPLAASYPVGFEPCNGSKTQMWGYDADEKQFKSRAARGAQYCLAYPNLDRRVVQNDTLADRSMPNQVQIMPCSPGDNRQKWVLDNNGSLVSYVSAFTKAMGFAVQVDNVRDAAGNLVVGPDGNWLTQRVQYTGMSTVESEQKKIQAFAAQP